MHPNAQRSACIHHDGVFMADEKTFDGERKGWVGWGSYLGAIGLVDEFRCEVFFGTPHFGERLVVLAFARLLHVVAVLPDTHLYQKSEDDGGVKKRDGMGVFVSAVQSERFPSWIRTSADRPKSAILTSIWLPDPTVRILSILRSLCTTPESWRYFTPDKI